MTRIYANYTSTAEDVHWNILAVICITATYLVIGEVEDVSSSVCCLMIKNVWIDS